MPKKTSPFSVEMDITSHRNSGHLQHRTRIFLLISLVKSVQLLMESGPQWENIQTIDGVIRLTFNYLNMNELYVT